MLGKREFTVTRMDWVQEFIYQLQSIYCKSTIYFRRHNNIMVYLLNFNITYIIILATCFDSYESSSGINFKNYCTYCFTGFCLRQKTDSFLSKTKTCKTKNRKTICTIYYCTYCFTGFCLRQKTDSFFVYDKNL